MIVADCQTAKLHIEGFGILTLVLVLSRRIIGIVFSQRILVFSMSLRVYRHSLVLWWVSHAPLHGRLLQNCCLVSSLFGQIVCLVHKTDNLREVVDEKGAGLSAGLASSAETASTASSMRASQRCSSCLCCSVAASSSCGPWVLRSACSRR